MDAVLMINELAIHMFSKLKSIENSFSTQK